MHFPFVHVLLNLVEHLLGTHEGAVVLLALEYLVVALVQSMVLFFNNSLSLSFILSLVV